MVKVIKRSGKKEAFSPGKIKKSVEKAAREVGMAPKKIRILISDVADPLIDVVRKKRVVKAVDIRKSMLRRLDRRAKSVSGAWRRYDKRHR